MPIGRYILRNVIHLACITNSSSWSNIALQRRKSLVTVLHDTARVIEGTDKLADLRPWIGGSRAAEVLQVCYKDVLQLVTLTSPRILGPINRPIHANTRPIHTRYWIAVLPDLQSTQSVQVDNSGKASKWLDLGSDSAAPVLQFLSMLHRIGRTNTYYFESLIFVGWVVYWFTYLSPAFL